MKKIIVQFLVSLDGYYEGPKQELDWHLIDDEFDGFSMEMLNAADVLVMGRKTYELMASYWPNAEDDSSGIKEKMNSTPKLVFSKTLNAVEWQNSSLATGSIADEIDRLKSVPGDGLIVVGGSDLASSFLEQGLIDEIRLTVTPILLGGGKRVFDGITKRHSLSLISTRVFKSGNVALTYRPTTV